MIREPVWSKSYGTAQLWSHIPAAELQQAMVTYIHGKLTTVDDVYWLRSSENPQVKIERVWEPHKRSFADWWLSAEFQSERDNFVEILAKEAVSTRRVGEAEARTIILKAMGAYLGSCARADERSAKVSAINGLRSMISRVLRAALSGSQIRKIKAALNMKGRNDLGGLADWNRSRNVGPFPVSDDLIAELSEIERLVGSFYKARLS